MEWTVWLRIPGDIIFTVGTLAMIVFVVQVIWAIFRQTTEHQPQTAEVQEVVNG